MSLLDKITRLKESIRQEENPDISRSLTAVACGMTNFHLNLKNDLARQRYNDHCLDCIFNKVEPIDDLKVEDSAIPQLSGRMCDHCGGCTLSYKLRQSIKPCEFWK